jgi:hypothetical protein
MFLKRLGEAEFEGSGRYCHVVYPEGKPEDFRFCVAEGSK